MNKSYKREVAGALLLFWAILVSYVFFFADNVSNLETVLNGLTVWIVPPSLAVFGFHAHINKDKS